MRLLEKSFPGLCICLLSCVAGASAPPAGYVVGWGYNGGGAATGVLTLSPSGFPSYTTGTVSVAGAFFTNAVAVTAGGAHSLALTAEGGVVAWGSSLPHGAELEITSGSVSLLGRPLKNAVAVAAGREAGWGFSFALLSTGEILAWGDNSHRQISLPGNLSNAVAIAAGSFQGLALRADGTVLSWGEGNPPPPGLTNVTAVSAGGMYGRNLALTRDGHVVDWAVRASGYDSTVPAGLSNVIAVSAGWNHSLALKRDGTVIGWGFNKEGRATGIASVPAEAQTTGTVSVAGQVLSNVVAIAAAHEFSLALKADGTLAVWGQPPGVPLTPPEGLSNVSAIAASGYYCLAITTNAYVAERLRRSPAK